MRRIIKMAVASGKPIPWYLSGRVTASNCVAVYQPKGAASLAASYQNIVNPGVYDATPQSAPTWDATNGWKFTTSSWLKTGGLIPGDAWSAVVAFSNYTTGYCLFGAYTTFRIRINAASAIQYEYGTISSVAPDLTSGVLILAGSKAYRNGVDEGITLVPTASTKEIFINGRDNTNDLRDAGAAVYIQELAFYNTILSPAQAVAINRAVSLL